MARIGIVAEQDGDPRRRLPHHRRQDPRARLRRRRRVRRRRRIVLPGCRVHRRRCDHRDPDAAWGADVVLSVAAPTDAEIALLQPGRRSSAS
jgi:hypothetical protein